MYIDPYCLYPIGIPNVPQLILVVSHQYLVYSLLSKEIWSFPPARGVDRTVDYGRITEGTKQGGLGPREILIDVDIVASSMRQQAHRLGNWLNYLRSTQHWV